MPKPELTVLDGGQAAGTATRATRPRAKSLTAAIAENDELAELRALKALLGRRLQDPKTSAVAIAALSKQFREVGEQIAALAGGGAPTPGEGGSSSEPIPDAAWDDDI
jgi:hypothetical protein